MQKNDLLKTMDIFNKIDYKTSDVDYDLNKLNMLKKLSLLNNPIDYYREDKKEKKKAVKFYLSSNPTNVQERMSGGGNKSIEEDVAEVAEVDLKKPAESKDKIILFVI